MRSLFVLPTALLLHWDSSGKRGSATERQLGRKVAPPLGKRSIGPISITVYQQVASPSLGGPRPREHTQTDHGAKGQERRAR